MEDKEKHKRITPQGAWGSALIMLTNGKDKLSPPIHETWTPKAMQVPKTKAQASRIHFSDHQQKKNLIAVTK